ncbi:MAG TPA: DUF2090 domain-containing protein [Candidatus Paceibacterota bacterium]|nr:DUF2090 domain-containing protein [Candidatus Paceibacterota bacterium]
MSGYQKPLYMLPFDHRTFLAKSLFGSTELTPSERQAITHYKEVIYKGFLQALERGIPSGEGAILVDEEYGLAILKDAKARGIITAASAEKSGGEEFEFAYGEEFREHLKRVRPTFAKALIRWDPEGSEHMLDDILKLRELSVFCRNEGLGFLLEPITTVPIEERPDAIVRLITDFHRHGVEPDVWKVEGVPTRAGYERVVAAAREDGRSEVGVIVLGRNEEFAMVKERLKEARGIPGMIGFAIGRSIFWDPISSLHKKEISEDDASEDIASKFLECYRIFTGARE